MSTKSKKTEARTYLEKLRGGPLTVGGLLRSIRTGESESLAQFSKKLGVSTAHLSDIELGRKTVSPERAAKFAKKLGRSEEQFVRLSLDDILRNAGLKFSVHLEAA